LIERALAGPLKDSPEVVFAVRMLLCDGHFYASYAPYPSSFSGGCGASGTRCDHDGLAKAITEQAVKPKSRLPSDVGGQLCRLNLRTGEVKVLLEDPAGSMRDVCVHYDGRKILFSYRPAGSWYFHLHEINADGTGLKQLTDAPYQDGECTYLPDGGIAFTSTRANRAVGCYGSQVHLMYRCDADGGNIRPL
jgi:Tol biopolymer transport system component